MSENTFDFECGTVCIVDDEPSNIDLLSSILSNNCYGVLSSTDGDRALEIIRVQHPDLVLLDIMISPEVDGYEICRKLKEDDKTHDIPIIFISALDQTIDKVKAFSVGGVDYITKPFQMEEVLARVHTHILQHQIRKQQAMQYKALQKEIKRRKQIEKKLEQTNKQLELIVTIDPLSGLINRKHFTSHLEQEWRRMVREKKPLSIILCDIDKFEEFNQEHGPHAGDQVIQQIAAIVKLTAKRPGDIVARWGEDEFILLLPATDQNGAMTLAENILKNQVDPPQIDGEYVFFDDVSISIGVASTAPTLGLPKETLLSKATEALSQAKTSEQSIAVFKKT